MKTYSLVGLFLLFCLLSCKKNKPIQSCFCPDTYTFYQSDSAFVFLPNTFTPNGDNQNDKFRVSGNQISHYNLLIKDGYGTIEIIDSLNPFWDGDWHELAVSTCKTFRYELDVTLVDGTTLQFENEVLALKSSLLCPGSANSCFFEDQFSFGVNVSSNDNLITNCK